MRKSLLCTLLLASLFFSPICQAQSNPLPSGWSDGDVGSAGLAGSATYSNGTFTVNGSGQYIWNNSDQMNFAYQSLSGDGTIVARLVSFQSGSSYKSAGVMIRETLDPSSTHIYSAYSQAAIWTAYRASTGGNTAGDSVSNPALPYWVKAVRSGNSFSGWASSDGVNWVQIGASQTITMAQTVYVGLAVSSDDNSSLSTATFDNVSVTTPSGPSSPVITSLSPASGPVGTSVTITGSNFGSAQGASTITFNGSTATPASWSDTSIVAPVPNGAITGNVVVTASGEASNGSTFSVTSNGLPSGWADGDVGSVGLAGSAAYSNGTLTVSGSSQYIWYTADEMNFAYQPLSGDGAIVARLVSFQGGSSYKSAGVMIRETLGPSSTHIYSA
jgi:hypothetical protein